MFLFIYHLWRIHAELRRIERCAAKYSWFAAFTVFEWLPLRRLTAGLSDRGRHHFDNRNLNASSCRKHDETRSTWRAVPMAIGNTRKSVRVREWESVTRVGQRQRIVGPWWFATRDSDIVRSSSDLCRIFARNPMGRTVMVALRSRSPNTCLVKISCIRVYDLRSASLIQGAILNEDMSFGYLSEGEEGRIWTGVSRCELAAR